MKRLEFKEVKELKVGMVNESSLQRQARPTPNAFKKKAIVRPEQKKKKQPEPDSTLPFVTQDTLMKEEQPDHARYSGRQARRTERETKRRAKPGSSPRKKSKARRVAKGTPSGKLEPAPAVKPRDKLDASKPARQKLESPSSSPEVVLPDSDPHHTPVDLSKLLEQDTMPTLVPMLGLADGLNLPETLEQSTSSSSSSELLTQVGDHGTIHALDEVVDGEITLLNQTRNLYWKFWDQVVRYIHIEWRPDEVMSKRDPYGNIHMAREYHTRVFITLNADGTVQQLRVSKSCGLDFMDDEATRAIIKAAPFPIPPEGLKDEDGLTRFEFGFKAYRPLE